MDLARADILLFRLIIGFVGFQAGAASELQPFTILRAHPQLRASNIRFLRPFHLCVSAMPKMPDRRFITPHPACNNSDMGYLNTEVTGRIFIHPGVLPA